LRDYLNTFDRDEQGSTNVMVDPNLFLSICNIQGIVKVLFGATMHGAIGSRMIPIDKAAENCAHSQPSFFGARGRRWGSNCLERVGLTSLQVSERCGGGSLAATGNLNVDAREATQPCHALAGPLCRPDWRRLALIGMDNGQNTGYVGGFF